MTLVAFYDLRVGPVSFDFVVFGIKAKMEAARVGAARVHFVIVPGDGPGGFRDKSAFYDQHEARWRFWNILLPACQLLGATFTYAQDWGQAELVASGSGDHCWPPDWRRQTLKNRPHLIGDVIADSRKGELVPRLDASTHARRKVREV